MGFKSDDIFFDRESVNQIKVNLVISFFDGVIFRRNKQSEKQKEGKKQLRAYKLALLTRLSKSHRFSFGIFHMQKMKERAIDPYDAQTHVSYYGVLVSSYFQKICSS